MLLAGCATPPPLTHVNNSREFAKSYDSVWEDVVGFFAGRNIAIKSIAKDSGVIYAESAIFDDTVADCGVLGPWRALGRQASLNVFVARSSSPRLLVSVNSEFIQRRTGPWGSIVDDRCSSTGAIEHAILDSIKP